MKFLPILVIVCTTLVSKLSGKEYEPIQVKADFQVHESNGAREDTRLSEKRPRPFLNAFGQIDFHNAPPTSSTVPPATSYKSTYRPHWQNHLNSKPTKNSEANQHELNHSDESIESALEYAYKPTFRPPILMADVSHVLPLSTAAPTTLTEVAEAATTTTSAHEKMTINFAEMAETVNQLSSKSLLNIAVIFGFPLVTAFLSILGLGPLAIASATWIIPLVAIFALPELLEV